MTEVYDYNLLPHNTFGISVKAKSFVEYSSIEELQSIIPHIGSTRVFHLGGGSNVVFTSDFAGLILHSAIKGIEVVDESESDIIIRVGAGEVWDEVVQRCIASGWYGLENLSLIPGETGASAVQNIGAYGSEIELFITTVETVNLTDGSARTFTHDECRYAYRHSIFKEEQKDKLAITHVSLKLQKQFTPNLSYAALASEVQKRGITDPTAQDMRDIVIDIRNSKLPDPKNLGNAGSFFMNPVVPREIFEKLSSDYPHVPHYEVGNAVKIPAGWLIEQCGWKGKSMGRVGVYEKQALILVNRGGCNGEEVMQLSNRIIADVEEKFGIAIRPEVLLI